MTPANKTHQSLKLWSEKDSLTLAGEPIYGQNKPISGTTLIYGFLGFLLFQKVWIAEIKCFDVLVYLTTVQL